MELNIDAIDFIKSVPNNNGFTEYLVFFKYIQEGPLRVLPTNIYYEDYIVSTPHVAKIYAAVAREFLEVQHRHAKTKALLADKMFNQLIK